VSPTLAVRLGQALPLLRFAERGARRIAKVSAVSAIALAAALEWPQLRAGAVDWPVALIGLGALLAPAGLTWLGVGALRELLTLPSRLRVGAAEAVEKARAVAASSRDRVGRAGAFYRALRAARGLAGEAASLGTAARLVRLSKLPLLLLMVAGFALNFVVILAAVVVVGLRLLGVWP